ncbi:MAG: ARMT1-like domain-containing protein [Deltaproteobacteria bacterium]
MPGAATHRQEPLKPFPQCVDCLMKLAESAAVLADSQNARLQKEVQTEARKILERGEGSTLSSPQMANLILKEIKNRFGVPDPYETFKRKEMALARQIVSRLEQDVGPDLRSRVGFAVLGNSLDFFKDPEESLAAIPGQLRKGLAFFYDDTDRLEVFLSKEPDLVLYLTDNAGEIFFDLPLYDYIGARAKETVLVVKGGPSLNDLTRAELREAQLEDRFRRVADTGVDGAGVDWDRVSDEFLELVEKADLILSKGMANFETIYPKDLFPAAFFLLKAKCRPIQDYLHVPPESFLAFWRDGHKVQ